jgi:hypothetical protein
MDPNQETNSQKLPESPGANDVAPGASVPPVPLEAPKKKWPKILLITLNGVPITLSVLTFAWLYSLQSSGASGTEYIALILFPVFGIMYLAAIITDLFFLIRYIRRSRRDPNSPKKRRVFAYAAVFLLLGIVAYNVVIVGYIGIDNWLNDRELKRQDTAKMENAFNAASADPNNKFEILLPSHIPNGYKFANSNVESFDPATTYFWARYANDEAYADFTITTYRARDNFNPPNNCGYALAPPREDDPDTINIYPCEAIDNQSPSIYSAYNVDKGESYLPLVNDYYLLFNDTIATIEVINNEQSIALSQDEVINVMRSLHTVSVADVSKL